MNCRCMVSTCVQILLSFVYFSFSNDNCYRYESGCCPGYEWNSNLGNCTECNIGYSGRNCSKSCVYPSYGWKCTLECNCPKEYCNYSTGCAYETWGQTTHTSAAGAIFTVTILCLSVSAILLLLVIGSLKYWKYIKFQSTVKEEVTEENHYETILDHNLILKF